MSALNGNWTTACLHKTIYIFLVLSNPNSSERKIEDHVLQHVKVVRSMCIKFYEFLNEDITKRGESNKPVIDERLMKSLFVMMRYSYIEPARM